jgi:hypothetical protein
MRKLLAAIYFVAKHHRAFVLYNFQQEPSENEKALIRFTASNLPLGYPKRGKTNFSGAKSSSGLAIARAGNTGAYTTPAHVTLAFR